MAKRSRCRISDIIDSTVSQLVVVWLHSLWRSGVSCLFNRCLARSARCNTMSHITADAGFSCMPRAKRPMRHRVTPHRRREYLKNEVYCYFPIPRTSTTKRKSKFDRGVLLVAPTALPQTAPAPGET